MVWLGICLSYCLVRQKDGQSKIKNSKKLNTLSALQTASFLPSEHQAIAEIFCIPSTGGMMF